MHVPADFWFIGRHKDLIREASQRRVAREVLRARKGRGHADESETRRASARKYPVARLGNAADAPQIAVLLELNGMPRWVAFEEQFIVAEEKDGRLAAAVRFREGADSLRLGLLVTDPWIGEAPVVATLYAKARAVAEGRGLREVRTRTRGHETQLREAGYRRLRGGWRLDVSDDAGRSDRRPQAP
jgi:hypothetical protein